MLSRISGLYFRGLPYMSSFGMGVGIADGLESEDGVRMMQNMGMGVIFGIFYPVSMPILGVRLIKKLG